MKIRNTFIIFIVSGFWHGANWTFIVWGFLNALYILPSIVLNTHRNYLDTVANGKYLPSLKEFFAMSLTFALTIFAWIFFRANNVSHAFAYISEIFSSSILSIPDFVGVKRALMIIILSFLFLLVEWIGRDQQYAIANLGLDWYRPLRWAMYFSLILPIIYYASNEQEFIYFQF